MKSLRLAAAAAVLVLTTTGCGGDGDGESPGDSSAGDDTSLSPRSDDVPDSGGPIDTCALISADELSEATGADYGDGVADDYGQCTWRVGGATANNGEGQLVVVVQEVGLDVITSTFTGGVDATVDGRDAYWNPDEGLQSLWVDLGGRCLVLSFDPVDDGSQAVAEEVAAVAVGNL
jgi:hypothetical protein